MTSKPHVAPSRPLGRLVPQAELALRVGGKSGMTIHRWVKAGVLPPPVTIRGRNFWPEEIVASLIERGDGARRAEPGPE